MKILGVIPARYASSRFPAKALYQIAGKSMVQRVYEQACRAQSLYDVVVATDHELIYQHIEAIGGKVVMTAESHPSGTDRCYEALQKMGGDFDFVLNIQGDEPFIQPAQIDTLAEVLQDPAVEIATLMKKISDAAEIFDENEVKITFNTRHEALYFSRSPIPFIHKFGTHEWPFRFDFYKHVGLYAYRSDVLAQITALSPSPLEQSESLEQLRWLEHGFKIRLAITALDSFCIDVPADIEGVDISRFLKD